MIRRLEKADIDRVAEIWLDTSRRAHAFIPAQYWEKHLEEVCWISLRKSGQTCIWAYTRKTGGQCSSMSGKASGFSGSRWMRILAKRNTGWRGRKDEGHNGSPHTGTVYSNHNLPTGRELRIMSADRISPLTYPASRHVGSIQDGPGIQGTVFVKGCPLHCTWCTGLESNLYRRRGQCKTLSSEVHMNHLKELAEDYGIRVQNGG